MTSKEILIYPVPWDITTTFRHGTAKAPDFIRSIIHQLDESHPFQQTEILLSFLEPNASILDFQTTHELNARHIIQSLNQNQTLTHDERLFLDELNSVCESIHGLIYTDVKPYINQQVPFMLCGGEHGVGLSYLKALSDIYSRFSILQIDAHMDCRSDYLGFKWSHASISAHYSKLPAVDSISQVGVRDYAAHELQFQQNSATPFYTFLDYDIHKQLFQGVSWHDISTQIIGNLSDNVFISLDVDGLLPALSPNTGTPVPGGITYNQLVYLLDEVRKTKRIIGAELVEVSCCQNESIDAIFGARLLHLLAGCLI